MERETIEKLVTSSTKIDINTKRRQREIVEARALYYKLCKEYTFSTLSQIGKSVGKDHTTVLWGLQNFDNWSSQNVGLRSNYIRLKTKIQTLLDEQDLANESNEVFMDKYLRVKEENLNLVDINKDLSDRLILAEEMLKECNKYA
jgi:hypothetical protein